MGFFKVKVEEDKTQDHAYQDIPLLCPRCHVVMKKIHKNNVTIDVCTKCKGMWLDDNEINKLIQL